MTNRLFCAMPRAIGLSLALCLPATAAGAAGPVAGATPLNAYEIYRLYADKTWTWSTGGGRFVGEGRRLVAWTSADGIESFAEGRWTADNDGQLCMRAVWTNRQGSAKADTCFDHWKVGELVYQRRQPDGDWYVFKHAEPQADDEYAKLVPTDPISKKAADLKQVLMAGK